MRGFKLGSVLACGLAVLAVAGPARAEEMALKGAFFISAGGESIFRKAFDQFVNEVNAKGAGKVKIASVTGPEGMPGNQMPNALRNGIVDIIGVPPGYLAGLLPGAEGMASSNVPAARQRTDGTYDSLRGLFKERANAYFLAQYGESILQQFFANKPINKLDDVKGMRIRTTSTYRAFLTAVGAIPVSTQRGEVYTALERGVVDGYLNISTEVKSEGWAQVTKYRIDPGIFQAAVIILINHRTWDKMNAEQKAFMDSMGKFLEIDVAKDMATQEAKTAKELEKNGIQVIKLNPEEAGKLQKIAFDATWDNIVKNSPESGAVMRKLLYR